MRADAEARRRRVSPIDLDNTLEMKPGSLTLRRWIVDPSRRLPTHEMQIEKFALVIAFIG